MKRKLDDTKQLRKTVESDCEALVAAVRDGSYPQLQKIEQHLLREKQRRLALADKQRKFQIKNINELYEYDVRAVESQFQEALEGARGRLVSELRSTATELMEQLEALRTDTGGQGKENAGNAREHASLARAAAVEHSVASDSLRPKAHPPKPSWALPVASMRQDFADIVSDLRNRATALRRSAPEEPEEGSVRILQMGGSYRLVVGATSFGAGDLVTVFSVLSHESFSGVVTSISSDEVSVRCGSGARLCVGLSQLLQGLAKIQPDVESIAAYEIVQKQSDMARRAAAAAGAAAAS